MSNTPACLFGAGALGHLWVATRVDMEGEQILCQTSYGADAVRIVDDTKTAVLGAYYERVGRIKRTGAVVWRKRTRGYALLDQPQDGRPPYEPDMETEA